MIKLEVLLKHALTELPEEHTLEAEGKAKQAFVLSLLEQGDLNVEQSAELLELDADRLVKLAVAHNIWLSGTCYAKKLLK